MTATEVRAFVDRIEGDKAVLLLGEEEEHAVILPTVYLPDEAGEGTVLTIIIRCEPQKTDESVQQVSDLIRRLTGDA